MGRQTVYNARIASDEKYEPVNPQNKALVREFESYNKSSNKAPNTIYQYTRQLRLFFCWNYENNNDKFFVDLKKRDFINFFNYLTETLKSSTGRVASFKGVLSSLSAYIENILDDEYPDFKNIVKTLQPIPRAPSREKTILDDEIVEKILTQLVVEKKYQLACFLALLASSGMRRSEILEVTLESFTTKQKITMGCMYETNKIRTKGRGKEGKVISRLVFKETFDPYLHLWLKEREEKGINVPTLFVRYKNGQYLPAVKGTINSFVGRINEYTPAAFYPHCMRHYFVTSLKKKGYPDDIIQKLVRWSSVNMVGIYNDLGEEEELSVFFEKVSSGEIEIKEGGVGSTDVTVEDLLEMQRQAEERAKEEAREKKRLYRQKKRAEQKDFEE